MSAPSLGAGTIVVGELIAAINTLNPGPKESRNLMKGMWGNA